MKNYKTKQKRSCAKAIAIAVFAVLYIAAVVAAVLGWLRVQDYELKLEQLTQLIQGTEEPAPDEEPTKATKRIARDKLAAPETVAAYYVVQESTYEALPAGARNIEVGDDLSGVLLYIDYPNLDYSSIVSPTLETGTYYMWRQTYSGMTFGYTQGSFTNIMSTASMEYFFSTMPYNKTDAPITAYELPADFGEVTSVNESSSVYSALYIVDPGSVPSVPQGTVTSESPYEGHNFDCGKELEADEIYSDGYLAVNVSALKPLISGINNGNILKVGTQEYIVISDGALSYKFLRNSSEYSYTTIYDSETTSDYVYMRVDYLQSLSEYASIITSDTFRYITTNVEDYPHEHIDVQTEFPVEGCTNECAISLTVNKSYGEGYVVINTEAFGAYAETHSGIMITTQDHAYAGFKIDDGALKYYQNNGTVNMIKTICNGETEAEYVYVHMPDGMKVWSMHSDDNSFRQAFVGYLLANPKKVTVTVEKCSGTEIYELHKGAALTAEHSGTEANYGWSNTDGVSVNNVTQNTTFTETYSFAQGHVNYTLIKPCIGNATVTITTGNEGEETAVTDIPYIQGYIGNSLWLLFDTEAYQTIIDTYIAPAKPNTSKIAVDVITASGDDFRTFTTTIGNLYSGGKAVENKYSILNVDWENRDDDFKLLDLGNSAVVFDVRVEAGKLPEVPEKEGYDFVGWFYGKDENRGTTAPCTPYNGEPITADTELHAHFAIKQFKVIYNTNGAGALSPATVNWNESAPIPDVERKGYNLIGWYLPDGTEYTGQAVTSDTVLKAEWSIKLFIVTFYVGDEVIKTLTVEYGTEFIKVSEAAEISVQDIASARYINEQNSDVEISEMLVTDDMCVQLLETSKMDKAMSAIEKYWLPAIIAVGVVFLIAVFAAIIVTNKRNNNSGNTRKYNKCGKRR